MKLNKVAMAVALTTALGSMSAFADTTNGQIEFQGELVNTACGLAPGSSPVTQPPLFNWLMAPTPFRSWHM